MMTEKQGVLSCIAQKYSALSDTDEAYESAWSKLLLALRYIAVSAGACNILSYMSAQPLRTRQIIEHYVTDKRYFSVRNWIKSGSIFGFDFIFNELPKQLLPFDYAAYRAYPGVLQVAATDIVNGDQL